MENQGANEVEPIDPTVCVVCKLPLVSRCKYCRRDDHRGVCDYTVDEVQGWFHVHCGRVKGFINSPTGAACN